MTYTLIRSRRKTLAIYIKQDSTVEVRAPLRLAKSEIERFVTSKIDWIEKKQAQLAARQPTTPRGLPTTPRGLPPSPYETGEFECTVRELVKTWNNGSA